MWCPLNGGMSLRMHYSINNAFFEKSSHVTELKFFFSQRELLNLLVQANTDWYLEAKRIHRDCQHPHDWRGINIALYILEETFINLCNCETQFCIMVHVDI